MPHYREKQNLKNSPKYEESVTALLFFFVLNFEGYLKNYRLCDQVKVTTVEKFASTLRDNAGEDPVVALAIVDQSINKGWKDLYPLKNYGRQGKPTAVSKKFSGNTLKDAEGKDIVFQ